MISRPLEWLAYHLIELADWLDSAWLTPPLVRAGQAVYRMADGERA